jgi:hypothetical protein
MRLWVFKRHFSTIFQLYIDLWATFPGANMLQGRNTLGYLRKRTFYNNKITFNMKVNYLYVRRDSGYLKIFITLLEVNMSNILWSMHICKLTFFPVCRMSDYVNTLASVFLSCNIFAPGKVVQRSIYNWNIVEKWRLNTHSLI